MPKRGVKAQAAMEFLLNYGWAILVVLTVIGALSYYGVLDPMSLIPDRCTLPPGPLSCDDFVVYASPDSHTGYMTFYFDNVFDYDIYINRLNITDDSYQCYTDVFRSRRIPAGGKACISVKCPYPGRISKRGFDIDITYSRKDGLNKTLEGTMFAGIEKIIRSYDYQSQSYPFCSYGDANGDGYVDYHDLDILRETIVGLHGYDPILIDSIDYDNDGYISLGDIVDMQIFLMSCSCCSEDQKADILEEALTPPSGQRTYYNFQIQCFNKCGLPYDNCIAPYNEDLNGLITLTGAKAYVFDGHTQFHATLTNSAQDPIDVQYGFFKNSDYCVESFPYPVTIPPGGSACAIFTCDKELPLKDQFLVQFRHSLPDRTSQGFMNGSFTISMQQELSYPSAGCHQAKGDGNGDRRIDSDDLDMIDQIISGNTPDYVDESAYDIDGGGVHESDRLMLEKIIFLCSDAESRFEAAKRKDPSYCGEISGLDESDLKISSVNGFVYPGDISQVHVSFTNSNSVPMQIKSMSFSYGTSTCSANFMFMWEIPAGGSACAILKCNTPLATGSHDYDIQIKYTHSGLASYSYLSGTTSFSTESVSSFDQASVLTSCHQAKGDGDGTRRINQNDLEFLDQIVAGNPSDPVPSYIDKDAYDMVSPSGVGPEDHGLLEQIVPWDQCDTMLKKFGAARTGDISVCS